MSWIGAEDVTNWVPCQADLFGSLTVTKDKESLQLVTKVSPS